MRFLVDECTGTKVADWLKKQNHEIFSVFDEARGMDDRTILEKCFTENRILITTDKDFGEMVIRENKPHKGIIFLRLVNESYPNKIKVIGQLLNN